MGWKIIKEHKRKYADTSYYFKAERDVPDGTLILEIKWIERFMYNLEVNLYSKNTGLKSIFKKVAKQYLYGHLIHYNDRIEKYGHQIMRMTEDSPTEKLKRLDSFQKDGVLNYNIREKYDVDFTTHLPEKDNYKTQ